jgi:hypothetical protein
VFVIAGVGERLAGVDGEFRGTKLPREGGARSNAFPKDAIKLCDRVDLPPRFARWNLALAPVAKVRVHRNARCDIEPTHRVRSVQPHQRPMNDRSLQREGILASYFSDNFSTFMSNYALVVTTIGCSISGRYYTAILPQARALPVRMSPPHDASPLDRLDEIPGDRWRA